ncbi:decarboxylase [Rhodococcus koreensis]|uniref:Diaminopimelate decarboxylase n=1 Tax=Rhodococcus koreensis TaxID=99653 RepID=A0A1H4X2M8_9NOCA|nr:decarboxylase [Rhodococcus koreensis]QSE80464.1 decarboxylase [Rhodococcus koreensis]SEC99823.1 diaminopimelate decarboxylase [Rhodococcus koreensis]
MTLHLPHLFAHEQSRQNTLLDLSVLGATGPGIEDALRAVTEQPQPRLVGFRCAADSEAIDDAIALMEQVRRDYGVILTELVLADADRVDLREAVDEALDEACARNRFPRPSVVFTGRPAVSALTKS